MTMYSKKLTKDGRPILTERAECEQFANWLRCQNGVKFTHIANETWTTSNAQKMRNRLAGVSRGVPDYMICIDPEHAVGGRAILIFVEMKRSDGGHVEQEQREWIEALDKVADVQAFVCIGADHAIGHICAFLKKPNL